MNIHESAEDYLETILILKNRLGQVRSIDIVREMNFSKPSISIAMGALAFPISPARSTAGEGRRTWSRARRAMVI